MVNSRRILLVALVTLVASVAYACNIPVFRYALENWQPDPYRVAVVHRGTLSADEQNVFRELQQANSNPARPANITVFELDLDAEPSDDSRREMPAEFEELVRTEFAEDKLDQPKIALYFPKAMGPSIWQSELSKANADRLVDSPIRRTVTERIADGQSAVWILIKSGDAEKDAIAEQTLVEKLKLANEEVLLPDQSLIESEEEFRADNPIELRVEFSLLTVSRDDPAEEPFVAMLLNSEEDLTEFEEPIAVPIFGRGRTYFALVGKGINEDTILENCGFVCGACSCQVKQANPGIDTLMAYDWSAKITGSAMREPELPELTGFGPFEAQETINTSRTETSGSNASATNVASGPNAEKSDSGATVDATTTARDGVPTESPSEVTENAIETDVANQSPSADAPTPAPAPEYEQSILKWAIGGTTIAALCVFLVSFFFRRPI